MVSNTRAPVRTDPLRSLNLPRPISVAAREGRPAAFLQAGCQLLITQIQDEWQINDEWWREPINRSYFYLILADGNCRTIFHDLVTDTWYAQAY